MHGFVTFLAVFLALTGSGGAAFAAPMLPPGAPFPSWELTDHTGATVTSRDLAGRSYLLWFYPKAMTPGCTVEGEGLRDQIGAFRARGVEVLGVSFDAPAANAKFVQEYKFPFRLLSDTDRKLAVASGAANDPKQAVAKRVSYLIGPDGKVVKAYDDVKPSSHASDVLSDVAGLP